MIRHSATPVAHTLTVDDFEDLAAAWGVPVELPGSCAGWAHVRLPNGMRFRAWLPTPSEGRVA